MQGLSDFNLNLSEVLPDLAKRLKEGEALRQHLLSNTNTVNYENLILPLARFHHRLHCFWSPVAHLNAVRNTPELRDVYDKGVVKLTEYHVKLSQDEALFQAYEALSQSQDFAVWPEARRRVIENALRDFKLSGVGLPEDKKKQFQEIETRLSECTSQFEHHLMDAIDAWAYHTTDIAELAGLPAVLLDMAQEKAKAKNLSGYLFGIDAPTYSTIIAHAQNRKLREHFYKAYVTRASELGEAAFDNSKVMIEILQLRHELAKLLGYGNFAQVSLASKMAKTEERVLQFLRDLAARSRLKAQSELDEIKAFARAEHIDYTLEAYDLPYFSERMKEAHFGFSEEDLRPYFPLSRVLEGLFVLLNRLFGLNLQQKQVPVWDESVQFYEVYDEDNKLRGGIYMDFFARAQKRSGAWMDDACGRFFDHEIQDYPIAYLTCNFLKGESGSEACLLHDDIVTLFHEMGHVLQHVLTLINEPDVAGIAGIPWDAVELPSQFLENFAWQQEVIRDLSRHIKTGESLPEAMIQNLLATKTFLGAMQMLRQIEFALFDFVLYQNIPPKQAEEILNTLNEIRREVAVVNVPVYNRFAHGFSHIFAGGYAAGYYSYKWAEVLSADAFSRFEEEGIFNLQTGRAFRQTILESGGSRDALQLFVEFRGREPKIDALLQATGIGRVPLA